MITDCREQDGITIGLIDSIITISRILRDRDLTSPDVLEALNDLGQDEDVMHLLVDNLRDDFYYFYIRGTMRPDIEEYADKDFDEVFEEFKKDNLF